MNLYPQHLGADPGGPRAPADWTMTVGSEGMGGAAYYFADVHRVGVRVCRLVLAGRASESEQEARRLLVIKARLWIAEYLGRSQA